MKPLAQHEVAFIEGFVFAMIVAAFISQCSCATNPLAHPLCCALLPAPGTSSDAGPR